MSSPGASGTGAFVSVAGVRGRRIRQVETGADSAGPWPGSSTGTTDGLRVLRRLGTSPCSGGPAGVSPEPKTSRRRGQLRSRRHACRTSGLRERRGQRGGRSGRRQASALLPPGATNHPTALRDPDFTSVPGVRRYSRYRSRVSSGVSLEDPAAIHGADGDRIARPDSVSETAPSGAWGVRATGSVESLPEREWRRPRVGRRARRDTSRAGAGKGRHPTGIGGPARPAHSRGRHEEPEGRILAALLP